MARRDDEELFYVYADIAMLEKGILDITKSKTNDLDPVKYKFLHTYRPAFIGDMQEKLDEAMGYSNMRRYAETTPQPHHRIQYRDRIIYERVTCWKSLKNWINKKLHTSREDDDINGIDEYLFGNYRKYSSYWETSNTFQDERDIY